jgi:hypothetical protein
MDEPRGRSFLEPGRGICYDRREQLLTESRGDDSVFILRSIANIEAGTALSRRIGPALLAILIVAPCLAQEPKPAPKANVVNPEAPPPPAKLESPPKIDDPQLVPELRTIPVPHDRTVYNVQLVNAALIPRDKEGIWVVDFAFKPLRIRAVEIPGKGRKQVHYLYYKVTNRTGKPRTFVPEFIMVNEAGQKFHDNVIPQAVPIIQAREDATIPLLGAVNVMGMIPPSTKPDVDDAVYGVATWDKWDPKADRFSIFVRGLSDGYRIVPAKSGGKPTKQYKTLRIDFIRRGDEHHLDEKEIYLNDPPYEWVYW